MKTAGLTSDNWRAVERLLQKANTQQLREIIRRCGDLYDEKTQ